MYKIKKQLSDEQVKMLEKNLNDAISLEVEHLTDAIKDYDLQLIVMYGDRVKVVKHMLDDFKNDFELSDYKSFIPNYVIGAVDMFLDELYTNIHVSGNQFNEYKQALTNYYNQLVIRNELENKSCNYGFKTKLSNEQYNRFVEYLIVDMSTRFEYFDGDEFSAKNDKFFTALEKLVEGYSFNADEIEWLSDRMFNATDYIDKHEGQYSYDEFLLLQIYELFCEYHGIDA